MPDIPQAAIDAALGKADQIGFALSRAEINDILQAAEAVWPHKLPERDPRSTTAAATERAKERWRAQPLLEDQERPFGFGPVRA